MSILRAALSLALASLVLNGCVTSSDQHQTAIHYPEATPFDENDNAAARLAATKIVALVGNKGVLAVFGANWCHDSRALAGWLETPRFKALTDAHFEVVYIDVGVPQAGEGRNLELAEQHGLTDIKGTPTLMVLSGDGALLNPDTAKSWRNAASRSEDEIYAELESFAKAQD